MKTKRYSSSCSIHPIRFPPFFFFFFLMTAIYLCFKLPLLQQHKHAHSNLSDAWKHHRSCYGCTAYKYNTVNDTGYKCISSYNEYIYDCLHQYNNLQ